MTNANPATTDQTTTAKRVYSSSGNGVGTGAAIGAAVGAAYGSSTGNMAQSLAVGVAIGTALGAMFDMNQRGKSKPNTPLT